MTYKVMIADDEPIMRKALQSLIDWNAIDCEIIHVAANGQEVLEFLGNPRVDILITDILNFQNMFGKINCLPK